MLCVFKSFVQISIKPHRWKIRNEGVGIFDDGFWQIFWRAFLNVSVQALLSLHRRRNTKSPRAKSATDRELLSRTPNVASLVFRFASTASYYHHHHHHCPSFQFISRVRIEQERRSVWLQKFLLDANFGLGPSLQNRVQVGPASRSNVNRPRWWKKSTFS